MVFILEGANKTRWSSRKRIAFDQTKDLWFSLQQADAKIQEAGILLIIAERCEPHLPIQTRLMWLNKFGTNFYITGFVLELIIQPICSIITSLDNDFRPSCGHDCEQAVTVDGAKGGDPLVNGEERAGPGKPNPKHRHKLNNRNGKCHTKEWNSYLTRPLEEMRTRELIIGRVPGPQLAGQKVYQKSIVQKKQAKNGS